MLLVINATCQMNHFLDDIVSRLRITSHKILGEYCTGKEGYNDFVSVHLLSWFHYSVLGTLRDVNR